MQLKFLSIVLAGAFAAAQPNLAPRPTVLWAASCSPPLKVAAGACVRSCPAGFADEGRVCMFRSLNGED